MRLRSVFLALSPVPATPVLAYGWFAIFDILNSRYEMPIAALPIVLLVPLSTAVCFSLFLAAFDNMYRSKARRIWLEASVAAVATLSFVVLAFGIYGAVVNSVQIQLLLVLVFLLAGPLAGGYFVRKRLRSGDA